MRTHTHTATRKNAINKLSPKIAQQCNLQPTHSTFSLQLHIHKNAGCDCSNSHYFTCGAACIAYNTPPIAFYLATRLAAFALFVRFVTALCGSEKARCRLRVVNLFNSLTVLSKSISMRQRAAAQQLTCLTARPFGCLANTRSCRITTAIAPLTCPFCDAAKYWFNLPIFGALCTLWVWFEHHFHFVIVRVVINSSNNIIMHPFIQVRVDLLRSLLNLVLQLVDKERESVVWRSLVTT